ncbi:hypothetical protein IAR55_005786 [Kwoniella newhampshirensis]|uniref:Myb-like domain-containing protein n=1 Tax=Kwoniella newhampshirensis TaxID=1651941 RepID=A0AAW0YHA6_9TREE
MSEIPQKMPRSGPTRSTTDVNRTKPYIRPAKPQKKANNQPHSDKDVGVESGFSPSASESSSSDEDDGSVFAPDNPIDETTSLAHTNDLKRSMMDGYEEDLKPTIEFSEDEKDIKPALKNGQRSASPKKTPTKHIKTESASSPTPSPKKNGPKGAKAAPRTWTAEEDWSLFKELHPKVDKPNWGGVAGIIGNGRDAKSCQNRYAVMSKRLEGAIKGIGGSS